MCTRLNVIVVKSCKSENGVSFPSLLTPQDQGQVTDRSGELWRDLFNEMAAKPIASPIPVAMYPSLAVFTLAIGLVITASFFIYEATSSRKTRSLAKELATAAVASVFLGFGSLFLLLASGVYV